jgi:ABC-2 type transport system permease protein
MLLVVFTSVPMLFLTGISWPQTNIPGAWQGVSWLIPSTFGIRGFLRISSMGGTLHDIQPEYQALWIQTLVYFLMTCLVYRFQIISARRHALEAKKALK